MCQDQKSVICIVKNGSVVVENTGHLDSFTQEKSANSERFSQIFDNGQKCDKFGGDKNVKTRIDYFCPDSKDYTSPLTLMKSSDPCLVNFFVWYEGENCQKVKSRDCIVDIPSYDTKLDLSVLKSTKVYEVKNGTDTFQVNLCSGIESADKCPKGVGLCDQDQVLVKSGFQISTWFADGNVKMTYSQDSSSKVEFTFVCDLNEDVKIEFSGKEEDKYTFLVKTKRVCLSQPQSCQFHDLKTGNFYDLSGLRTSTEWIGADERDKDRKYHLSICKPISPASLESSCADPKTAICAESNKTKDSIVIATVTSPKANFEMSNDQALILTYDQGSRCNARFNYSAQIIFRCDENSGNPMVMDILDNCTYIFEWKTSHACPQIADESKSCQVKDDFFGHTFDLSPLKGQDHKIGDFSISICGALETSACGSGASICYKNKNIGLKSSEKLHFSEGELFLEYQGQQCKDVNYTSNIMFVCDHDIGLGAPELGIQDDCHFVFTWKTSYVCPPHEEIDCQVKDENNELFDFSDLALSDDNYEIPMRNENEIIILNTCKSLVHSSMARCPYNSAVCLRQKVDGKYVFTSLGQVGQSPQLDEYHRLVLEYPNGGICKEQGTKEPHISTKIVFK